MAATAAAARKALSKNSSAPRRPLLLALSLTGSGHLLVYQLGACRVLLGGCSCDDDNTSTTFRIRHVAGASGGALAAAVVTHIPHRLNDYAEAFIEKRGGISGLRLFQDLLKIERNNNKQYRLYHNHSFAEVDAPMLHIAVTRCRDGKGQHFSFSPTCLLNHDDDDDLIRCLEASCRIPPSFHPYDILSSSVAVYPEQDGIVLRNGEAYVDGGIATPAPPTPLDHTRLIVSPLTGTSSNESMRISPNAILSSNNNRYWGQVRVAHDLGIHVLSWSNLRALRAAMGLVTSSKLRDWYQKGQDDAHQWLQAQ